LVGKLEEDQRRMSEEEQSMLLKEAIDKMRNVSSRELEAMERFHEEEMRKRNQETEKTILKLAETLKRRGGSSCCTIQ
jgi:hypothetical protein